MYVVTTVLRVFVSARDATCKQLRALAKQCNCSGRCNPESLITGRVHQADVYPLDDEAAECFIRGLARLGVIDDAQEAIEKTIDVPHTVVEFVIRKGRV